MRPLRLCLVFASCFLTILVLACLAASRTQAHSTSDDATPGLQALFSWHTPSSLFPPSAIISLTDDNSTFFLARPANFGPLLPSKGLSGPLWIGSGFGDDNLGRGGIASAEGELGCSDIPGWTDGQYGNTGLGGAEKSDGQRQAKVTSGKDEKDHANIMRRSGGRSSDEHEYAGHETTPDVDGTDDHLHHPLLASSDLRTSAKAFDSTKKASHADIQSIQESAEIAGKVVLLSRGGCGFLEKTKWVQRRGGTALIVGDNVRGGPLVPMYARGDTSNITIPSLFTSYTSAHLLSSLIPSGGFLTDPSIRDAARLGLALGDQVAQGSDSHRLNAGKSGKGSVRTSNKKTESVSSSSKTASKDKQGQDKVKTSKKTDEEHTDGWLRWAFPDVAGSDGKRDSRRPPSSGNIDWVLQEDFNEKEQANTRTTRVTTITTKTASATKTATQAGGDGFRIGVQDWRDPDLIEPVSVAGDSTTRSSSESHKPENTDEASLKGGSITPGSGDYSARNRAGKDSKPIKRPSKEMVPQDTVDGKARGWSERLWPSSKSSGTSHDRPKAAHVAETVSRIEDHEDDDDEDEDDDDNNGDRSEPHVGLWVTLQPTSMSASPFFDTLLVLVVSPLVTLTVVYALLLLRSRIRRRRWRAPKSVVERLPVRTYHTIMSNTGTSTNSSSGSLSPPEPTSPPDSTTPLLHPGARPISTSRARPRSHTLGAPPAASSSLGSPNTPLLSPEQVQEKREEALAEWKRRYGGKQKECVVCLEEYVDGVSRVMSLPCGHEFHVDCITPWLTTRRRTCPICKGDVVRSLARSSVSNTNATIQSPLHGDADADADAEDDEDEDEIQEQAAGTRNDDPAAAQPVSREDEAYEDLEQGMIPDRTR